MSRALVPLLALFALAGYAPLQDPVRLQATISPAAIEAGETTTLELTLETRGEKAELISLPELPPELELIRTSDFSQLQFSLPGGRSRIIRREFLLRATEPGIYEIPPITARVQGEEYRTAALTLAVSSGAGTGSTGWGSAPNAAPSIPGSPLALPGSPPGSLARGPRDEVLLHARLTTDTAYVNQQVVLRTQAWIADEAQFRLRRAPEYHAPNAPGFWTHDLPGPLQGGRQSFNAHLYRVQEFQRAYFPLAPGTYSLPPARLAYEVRRSFLVGTDPQELTTDSLQLVVLPFPEEGRTADFAGAVGDFTISARLEPSTVPVGEAAALVVEIEGTGNIKALPPPRIPTMDGIELYPPAEAAEVSVRQGQVGGKKRFTWILVPRKHGRLELPILEYHYFQPELRAYRTARAEPLSLQVDPGSGQLTAPVETQKLRGIRLEPAGESPLAWIRTPLAGALLLAAPLLALVPLVLRRRPGVRGHAKTRLSPRESQRQRRTTLMELRRAAATEGDGLFHDLATLIRVEIARRIGEKPPAREAASALMVALEEYGVPKTRAGALTRLLTRVESARFEPTPPGPAKRVEFVEEAERLLAALDRGGAPRERTGRAAYHANAGVVLLLTLPLAGASQLGEAAFHQAVDAYQAEEFTTAAQGFTHYLQAAPGDPAAWYNLGNAEFQADRRAYALHAWLHALNLEPRAADTRHNLRIAGAEPALIRTATRGVPLSETEVFLLAGLLWLTGAGLLTVYAFTRRRATAGAAAVALALALIALGTYVAPVIAPAPALALPDELPLRIAPEPRAQPIEKVAGGTPLRIQRRRGDWVQVATTTGTQGWVEAELVGELRGAVAPRRHGALEDQRR